MAKILLARDAGTPITLDDALSMFSNICENVGCAVPASFLSRKASFKEKLHSCIDEDFKFIFVRGHGTVLLPREIKGQCSQDQCDSSKVTVVKAPLIPTSPTSTSTVLKVPQNLQSLLPSDFASTKIPPVFTETSTVTPQVQ